MDDGRRNALYRIMATTDWKLRSNDSRTMSEGGRNKSTRPKYLALHCK